MYCYKLYMCINPCDIHLICIHFKSCLSAATHNLKWINLTYDCIKTYGKPANAKLFFKLFVLVQRTQTKLKL